MEAVQITASFLEVPDPSFRLCYHHVAVECTPSIGACWALYVWADLSNYGRSEGHIGHEMAVHNIDMKPVGSLAYCVRAFFPEDSEVGGQD